MIRTKLAVLAVAALLAFGTGSVVAAMDAPTADTESDDVLPANYTVDVINPDDVSDEEIDEAIETVWANEEIQRYFDAGAAVHFEVWASTLEEDVVHVKVAPMDAPDETRVLADVTLSEQQITAIDEPVKINASNAITINADDYDLNVTNPNEDASGEDNATRLTADQAHQLELNESSIERGGDGTFTFEVKDDGRPITTVPADEIIRIDLPPANRTVSGE